MVIYSYNYGMNDVNKMWWCDKEHMSNKYCDDMVL